MPFRRQKKGKDGWKIKSTSSRGDEEETKEQMTKMFMKEENETKAFFKRHIYFIYIREGTSVGRVRGRENLQQTPHGVWSPEIMT